MTANPGHRTCLTAMTSTNTGIPILSLQKWRDWKVPILSSHILQLHLQPHTYCLELFENLKSLKTAVCFCLQATTTAGTLTLTRVDRGATQSRRRRHGRAVTFPHALAHQVTLLSTPYPGFTPHASARTHSTKSKRTRRCLAYVKENGHAVYVDVFTLMDSPPWSRLGPNPNNALTTMWPQCRKTCSSWGATRGAKQGSAKTHGKAGQRMKLKNLQYRVWVFILTCVFLLQIAGTWGQEFMAPPLGVPIMWRSTTATFRTARSFVPYAPFRSAWDLSGTSLSLKITVTSSPSLPASRTWNQVMTESSRRDPVVCVEPIWGLFCGNKQRFWWAGFVKKIERKGTHVRCLVHIKVALYHPADSAHFPAGVLYSCTPHSVAHPN